MSEKTGPAAEFTALQAVIKALQDLDDDTRKRIFDTAGTFLQIGLDRRTPTQTATSSGNQGLANQGLGVDPHRTGPAYPPFSVEYSVSPKQFVLDKQPRSDVERIAVLAYYLTHFRDTPHFKTLDLSKLNTEAAQPKFSNAASSANNAVKRGYLVPTTKGNRQLSAAGEQFVNAMPDREAARQAMTAARVRRQPRRTTGTKKVSTSTSSAAKKVAATAEQPVSA